MTESLPTLDLPCPYCGQQGTCKISPAEFSKGEGNVVCSACKNNGEFQFRKVRSKKSRQKSDKGTILFRDVSLRLKTEAGDEELLEFQAPGDKDLEAKSGDQLLLMKYAGRLIWVLNLTITQALMLARPIDADLAKAENDLSALTGGPASGGCCFGVLLAVIISTIVVPLLETPGNRDLLWLVSRSSWSLILIVPAVSTMVADHKPERAARIKELKDRVNTLRALKAQ